MTYKRADRPGWPRLRAQRFVCQRISEERVSGYVTLLDMVEVTEPLVVTHKDQSIRIADAGYSWLQIFPEGANYTHTTMFDAEGQPVQEYIDLIAEQGLDDAGIPWYDDLYLDIAWIPEGSPLLLDQEELEAAHAIGAITQEQYDMARGETARLLVALALGEYMLPEVTRACYPALRAALDASDAASPATSVETPTIIADVPASADEVATPLPAAEDTVTGDESTAAADAELTASAAPIDTIEEAAQDAAPTDHSVHEKHEEHVEVVTQMAEPPTEPVEPLEKDE